MQKKEYNDFENLSDNQSVDDFRFNTNYQEKYDGFSIKGKKSGYGHLYYLNGSLHSAGTFHNDKLEGTHITYYYPNSDIVSFEGEMQDGIRSGHGKEYYKTGAIMYEGFFKNDEWHGNEVKIYHYDGELEYEGQIYRGMREGYGRAYYDDGR